MSEDRFDFKRLFFGFLTGAALGAGLALLFAPKSGKETRKMLKDFGDKITHEVKKKVNRIRED